MLFRLSRLNEYLKKNYYQKWREISSIGSHGPRLSNPLRGIPYLFSNIDESDELLLKLKNSAKRITVYSFFSLGFLIATIIIAIFIMITIS